MKHIACTLGILAAGLLPALTVSPALAQTRMQSPQNSVAVQVAVPAAAPQGQDGRVAGYRTTHEQTGGRVSAALAEGGHVVAWAVRRADGKAFSIFSQRFDPAGKPTFPIREGVAQDGSTELPLKVVGLANGGYVLAWATSGPEGSTVYAQPYLPGASSDVAPIRVNEGPMGGRVAPGLAATGEGGFAVAWTATTRAVPRFHVTMRRYQANGAPASREVDVASTNDFVFQEQVSVVPLAEGGIAVAWASLGQDGSGWGVYARQFDQRNVAIESAKPVNTAWFGNQGEVAATPLKQGGYVITWLQSGSRPGVFAQRFAANGSRMGVEQRVDVRGNPRAHSLGVESRQDGGYVISWETHSASGDELFVQPFEAGGAVTLRRSPPAQAQATAGKTEAAAPALAGS
ncbi:MAG: hypothetical protein V4731_07165 [Pseudomonadota bacterium]